MCEDFFKEPKDASKVKGQIVAKYFSAWATIIANSTTKNIAYIDLFCGPGRYEDKTESTPLLVLQKAIGNPKLHSRFISIFTDKEQDHIDKLVSEIDSLQTIEKLKYKPQVECLEIGDQIVELFKNTNLIPYFIFLDPCGYKGLSLDLVNVVIKDWACECLFFFNYNRINAAIHNDKVEDHVIRIFGHEKSNNLQSLLVGKSPIQRERIILETLESALKENYGKYVHSFCIKDADRDRTSHYLIFVTKNFKAYELMKEIMAGFSDLVEDVPSFELNLRKERDLFDNPLQELKDSLLMEFSGKTEKMSLIYEQHSVGKRYIKRNYKKALSELFQSAKIQAAKPDGKAPRKGTMPDDCIISIK